MYLETKNIMMVIFLLVKTALTHSLSQNITINCEENHMEIKIAAAAFPKLDPTKFHLNDLKCISTFSENIITLRTALNGCGTTALENASTTTYKNTVRAYSIVKAAKGVSVTREEDLTLPFNCSYNRRDTVGTTSFQALRHVDAAEGSLGNFTFTMDLFKAKDFKTPYVEKDYPISVELNDPVFVQFQVKAEKADLHIFAERCLATTTTRETSTPNYVFLEDGCPLDSTMVYKYKANRSQNFTINAFRFISDHPIVYLHCLLMVCHRNSNGTKCANGCTKNRRKRDVSFSDLSKGTGLESKLHHLASGPLTRKRIKVNLNITPPPPDTDNNQTTTIVTIVAILGVILLIISIMLIACLFSERKRIDIRELEPLQLRQYDGDAIFLLDAESSQKLTVHI